MNHSRARRLIARAFERGTAVGTLATLRPHLDDCPACANLYRRYLHLESALCGPEQEVSVFSIERVRAGLAGRVQLVPETRSTTVRLSSWLAPLAAAAALTLVWLALPVDAVDDRVSLPEGVSLAPVGFAAKGAGRTDSSDVGVRMFRVDRPGAMRAAVTEAGEPVVATGRSPLHLSDTITFTYTNYVSDIRYLALFGIQPNGKVRWYFPGYGEKMSAVIATERVDEPLERGFRLSVNHTPGPLRVVAVFSKQAIGRRAIETAAGSLVNADLETLARFPLEIEGALQHSFLVRVQETDNPSGEGGGER